MPQSELTFSYVVKEAQKDTRPAADISVLIRDTNVSQYDGVKRLVVPAGGTKEVGLTHLPAVRYVVVEVLSGTGLRIRFRSAHTSATDIPIGRFFAGEIREIERLVLYNAQQVEVVVRLVLAG
jgi:hypothetical protein